MYFLLVGYRDEKSRFETCAAPCFSYPPPPPLPLYLARLVHTTRVVLFLPSASWRFTASSFIIAAMIYRHKVRHKYHIRVSVASFKFIFLIFNRVQTFLVIIIFYRRVRRSWRKKCRHELLLNKRAPLLCLSSELNQRTKVNAPNSDRWPNSDRVTVKCGKISKCNIYAVMEMTLNILGVFPKLRVKWISSTNCNIRIIWHFERCR